jgi:hypothetical protein
MTPPKKGNCGTCHWFERGPQEPPKDQPWAGSCLVNPPIPVLTQQQVSKGLGPRGPEMQIVPAVLGLLPTTDESRRCSLWRPAGAYDWVDGHQERVI